MPKVFSSWFGLPSSTPSQGDINRGAESATVAGLLETIASQKSLLEHYKKGIAQQDEVERGRLDRLREMESKWKCAEKALNESEAARAELRVEIQQLKDANDLLASRLENIAELCDLESALDDIDNEEPEPELIDSAKYGD